mmetsp:Transcript_14665/g.26405  ORF Transcript_14665/g.26405 Transcript_14665/m.26405 type:complete len:109 (-) Transcript_14665:1986-2312(-)
MDIAPVQYIFMMMFIVTFSVVFRFYISGIGRRISKKQLVAVSDYLVSAFVGSVLDRWRSAGGCSLVSTCFVFVGLLGLRTALLVKQKTAKDRNHLPFYNNSAENKGDN